jgi:hypothetical protein
LLGGCLDRRGGLDVLRPTLDGGVFAPTTIVLAGREAFERSCGGIGIRSLFQV